MKKIQTKLLLAALLIPVFGIISMIGTTKPVAADAATTYCSTTYGAKTDSEASDPKSAARDKALYDACVQGYQKSSCSGFQDTGGASGSDLQDACINGKNTVASANGSMASGSGQKCATAILPKSLCDDGDNGGVWGILLLVLNILTAGVGIAAVGGFVYAAILYTTSGDSPERVKKAKDMIVNIVIGLIAYGLMYALLQFIIPGGVFK